MNPYVSPVYGNFSKGFPPTLIQGGTKEFLLSDFVRLYQALDQAKVEVKLDVYEGMPHVFQSLFINTTESDIALSKMNDFLRMHLDYLLPNMLFKRTANQVRAHQGNASDSRAS